METLEDLHDHLSKLQDGLDELRELIGRLAAAGKPVDTDESYLDDDAAADLAAEIADGLRETQDDCELLQEDAADLGLVSLVPAASDSHDSARFKEGFTRLSGDIQSCHVLFRRARIQARQNLDAVRREDRREMLAAYAHPEESSDEEYDDDDDEYDDEYDEPTLDGAAPTLTPHRRHHTRPVRSHQRRSAAAAQTTKPLSKTHAAATDVTAALRQTHARIAGEVARSDFAAQTLAESTRALADLGDRYHGSAKGDLNAGLKSARAMVKGLVAAHKSDTWYLQMSLYLLLLTVGWLLFRRLLYGPLWLLVLWPVRSVVGTAMWMGRTVGPGTGGVARLHESPVAQSVSVSTTVVTSVVTANVGSVQATPGSEAAPQAGGGDSLVEEVGRIVDGQAPAQAIDEPENRPNPMKRMWEEDKEAARYAEQQREERQKDEL